MIEEELKKKWLRRLRSLLETFIALVVQSAPVANV